MATYIVIMLLKRIHDENMKSKAKKVHKMLQNGLNGRKFGKRARETYKIQPKKVND